MVPLKYSNDTAPYKKLNFFPPFLELGLGHPSVTCSWHVLWRTGQQFDRDAGGKKKGMENAVIFSGQCCRAPLLLWKKDTLLLCNRFETLWSPLANHFVWNTMFSCLFPILKQTRNSCEIGSTFASSLSEHSDSLKIKIQIWVEENVLTALWGLFPEGADWAYKMAAEKASKFIPVLGPWCIYFCENRDKSCN